MELKLLCIGDVVGSPGRRVLQEGLPVLVERYGVESVIVNAENAAAGSGLTQDLYQKIVRCGVHLITMGDHIYRRKEIIPTLETADNIVRPANLPAAAPGREAAVYQTASGQSVAVVSVLGRMFMKTPVNCPMAAVDRVLASLLISVGWVSRRWAVRGENRRESVPPRRAGVPRFTTSLFELTGGIPVT